MDKEAALGNGLKLLNQFIARSMRINKTSLYSTKAIATAAKTALEVFNVPIEDALFTGILRVKGCVEARNGASMCHHLISDVQSTLNNCDIEVEFFLQINSGFSDVIQNLQFLLKLKFRT